MVVGTKQTLLDFNCILLAVLFLSLTRQIVDVICMAGIKIFVCLVSCEASFSVAQSPVWATWL